LKCGTAKDFIKGVLQQEALGDALSKFLTENVNGSAELKKEMNIGKYHHVELGKKLILLY
jgi:hypothetical protein